MYDSKALLFGIALVLALPANLNGQQSSKGRSHPADGYDWRGAARKEGLSDKDIGQLVEKKILVTNLTFRQLFEPYNGATLPLFITSDSLLGGFHVLFEESVLRLELTNARRLAGVLKCIWANLQSADKTFTGKPQVVAGAKQRACIVVATALQLLGEKVALDATLSPSSPTILRWLRRFHCA